MAQKDPGAASILREALKHLKQKPEMRKDISRLSAACCAPQKYGVAAGRTSAVAATELLGGHPKQPRTS
jgi:hypothetical protein